MNLPKLAKKEVRSQYYEIAQTVGFTPPLPSLPKSLLILPKSKRHVRPETMTGYNKRMNNWIKALNEKIGQYNA